MLVTLSITDDLDMKMNNYLVLFFALTIGCVNMGAQIVHPPVGDEGAASDGSVKLKLIHKLQHFSARDKATYDENINSPKSVNIHPNGKKFYVNSLEGCTTVVYEMGTWKLLSVISHRIGGSERDLWAKPSGLFEFTHYSSKDRDLNVFDGKPVESTFSHRGRYLWVPYYRRSYDLNAQDPSAMAVIDTQSDRIIKLFETGPLPKMVACSHDGKHIAVTHWGNNTVGTLDISSENPDDWHYDHVYIVDYQLQLNFSLTEAVNRDSNTGYALRGTVFTPDDRYLFVSCMGGGGGIAVIDMERQQYLGRVLGMRANIRHLVVKDDWLYLGSNAQGVVQRIKLDTFIAAATSITGKATTVRGFEECTVMTGARTIEASPSGRFIFAACNNASKLCVVDTRQMKMVASTAVDSYPVGLDISQDGSIVITTSQGRKGEGGGNAVDIFQVTYAEPEPAPEAIPEIDETQEENAVADEVVSEDDDVEVVPLDEDEKPDYTLWYIGGGVLAVLLVALLSATLRRKRH